MPRHLLLAQLAAPRALGDQPQRLSLRVLLADDVRLTVRVTDGKVTSVEGATACLARALSGAAVAGTGHAAVHLERR